MLLLRAQYLLAQPLVDCRVRVLRCLLYTSSLPVGAELIAELTAPVVLPKAQTILVAPIATTATEKTDLSQLVEQLPFRTYTDKANILSLIHI